MSALRDEGVLYITPPTFYTAHPPRVSSNHGRAEPPFYSSLCNSLEARNNSHGSPPDIKVFFPTWVATTPSEKNVFFPTVVAVSPSEKNVFLPTCVATIGSVVRWIKAS